MSPVTGPETNIPERYEDVTAEWLTQALRSGGVLKDQSVSSFRVEPIGAEKSRTSSLARITVEYDGDANSLPGSIFAKFVSRISGNRSFVAELNLSRREIALYQHLGDAIPMNMPQMYFGAAEPGSDLAVILLEEIEGLSKMDLPLEEMTLTSTEIELALRELAGMHSKWWEDKSLQQYSWLLRVDDEARQFLYRGYEGAWDKLKEGIGPSLTPAEIRICNGLSDYLPTLMSEMKSLPVTLCHGDFHRGNLLWDSLGKPDKVWAVDWQLASIGPVVADVSWFLTVPRSEIHLLQQEYLPGYHGVLCEGGSVNYEYDRFLSDYRYGIMDSLARLVSLFGSLDFARDDFVEFARQVIGFKSASAEAMGCEQLINES